MAIISLDYLRGVASAGDPRRAPGLSEAKEAVGRGHRLKAEPACLTGEKSARQDPEQNDI